MYGYRWLVLQKPYCVIRTTQKDGTRKESRYQFDYHYNGFTTMQQILRRLKPTVYIHNYSGTGAQEIMEDA